MKLAGLALFALVLVASPARAWEPIHPSQPVWSGPVHYMVNDHGSDDLGGLAGTEPVVRQAFDDWTRVACTSLEAVYDGPSSSGSGATSVVTWLESSWPDDPNAIGVTTPGFDFSGNLRSATMTLNGYHYSWTTGAGSGSHVNAYSIVLHEAGHWYGLAHSDDGGAAMYFAYGGGTLSIGADDQAGICALYPGGAGPPVDCSATGCPTGQSCVGGSCVPDATGTGDTCDVCTGHASCGAGRCLLYPDEVGRCAASCVGDADCGGSNEHCELIDSVGELLCVRRDPAGTATCSIDPGGGLPPEPTAECASSRDCAGDERCDVSGVCVPVPTGDVGDACADGADCFSGICAVDSRTTSAFCTELCTSDGECPSGFACLGAGASRACGAVDPGTGLPGAPSPDVPGLVGTCSVGRGRTAVPGALLGIAFLLALCLRRRR